jgi:putative salt-induced outer membrane protein YdiY
MIENVKSKIAHIGHKCGLGLVALICLICFFAMVLPASALAEGGKPIWTPDGSRPEGFDWIQLTNGEWLKGDLKVLYNDSLEFDSDELGLLSFDWEDVQQVICHAPQSVRIEDAESGQTKIWQIQGDAGTVVGFLRIDGDKVFMETDEGTLEFDRSTLVSIAPGESSELDYWSIKLTLSIDLSGGNTEKEDYSLNLNTKRRTSLTRFYFDYRGIYSETQNIETSNSHRAGTYFDIFSTRRFYWRPVFAEYYRDPFANIAHRGTIGAGVGYTIIDTAKTEWILTPGIAYIYTEYDSVEAGEDSTAQTPALVVSTEYDTELTKKTDFNILYNFNVVNEESGTYFHHAKASLEIELTGTLDLDLSLIWDRIQDPAPDEDGIVPEQDDYYFFCGLSFEL